MFYQTEYVFFSQILCLIEGLATDGNDRGIPWGQARSIAATIFELDSGDPEASMDHAWSRPNLDAAQIQGWVERAEKTLTFNKVRNPSWAVNQIRDVLEDVAADRRKTPSSFVLYGVYSDEDGLGMIPDFMELVDQVEGRKWCVFEENFNGDVPIRLAPLFGHVLSHALRDEELSLVAPEADPVDARALKAIPESYDVCVESGEFLDELDEADQLTTRYTPLVVVRDGVMAPCNTLTSVELPPAWMWYIAGFPGLTHFAHWDAQALHSLLQTGHMDVDEPVEANMYNVKVVVAAVGLIMHYLATKGVIPIDYDASPLEVRTFLGGQDVLAISHAVEGIIASDIGYFERDMHEGIWPHWSGHRVFDVSKTGEIPTPVGLESMNLIDFMELADGIYFLNSQSVPVTLPQTVTADTVIRAEAFFVGGTIEGRQRLFAGVYDFRFMQTPRHARSKALELIKGLSQEQLGAIFAGVADVGINQLGELEVSDPCNLDLDDDPWGRKRVIQRGPLRPGSGVFETLLWGRSAKDLMPESVQAHALERGYHWHRSEMEWFIQANPFKQSKETRELIRNFSSELVSMVDEAELRRVLSDNIQLDEERLREVVYDECRFVDGFYVGIEAEINQQVLAVMTLETCWGEAQGL